MPAAYLETRDVPLADLTPYPGNARRGDVEAIRASLRRNGQYRSLIVRRTGKGQLIVLAGNNTLQALQAEGAKTARCEVITCDDAEARRINLADNRLAEMGTYDNDALAELLEGIQDDIDGTGWNIGDLTRILDTDLPEGFPTYDESIVDTAPPPAAPVPAAVPAAPAPAPAHTYAQDGDEDEAREHPARVPAATGDVTVTMSNTVRCPNCDHSFAVGR
jgi:hypothetical protein